MLPKALGKQEEVKLKISWQEEIIKIMMEINEMETKRKKYKETMKQRVGSLKRYTWLTNSYPN
jgi:hypothetical protein